MITTMSFLQDHSPDPPPDHSIGWRMDLGQGNNKKMMMRQEKKMNETIEDIIKTLPDDSYIKNYDEDEGFIDDIRGWILECKEEIPSSSITKWEEGDKLIIKVSNFIEDEDDPITNGENYYIVMEPNTPEQQEEE